MLWNACSISTATGQLLSKLLREKDKGEHIGFKWKHSQVSLHSLRHHGNKAPEVKDSGRRYRLVKLHWFSSMNKSVRERCNVLLHASACRGQCVFFWTELSPGRLAWDRRVMCTETESFSAVPVFRGVETQSTEAFAFKMNLMSCGETHATSRVLCSIQ